MLGKELAAASAEQPREALEVLRLLLDERHGSGLTAFDLTMRAVPTVIANALRSGDDALVRAAETYIKALWTGRPLRTLSDEIAEKTAREMDDYPGQSDRHLAELRAILDEQEPVYRH